MKTIKFYNEQRDIDVEYLVDLIGNSEPIAIYDVTQFVSGVPQWGLNGEAIQFGMFDRNKIDKTVSNKGKTHTPYTVTEFVEFAKGKNLTMVILEDGESAITKNALKAFAWVTETIDAGVSGEAQLDVLTFPVAAEAQEETITVLGTAGTDQADNINIYTEGGELFSVWFDIDAAGIEPTGVLYNASDYQIKVDIATGDTEIQVAGKAKAALELNADWNANFETIVDNGDGTLTITQTGKGTVTNSIPKSIEVLQIETLTFPNFAGATQGDYVNIYNQSGDHYAVWLDKDDDGTEPTGALYVASDYKIKVGIATGDTNIQVAGKVKADFENDVNWAGFEPITDNLDGTLTITNLIGGVTTDAVPKDAGDLAAGSIAVTVDTNGETGVGSIVVAVDNEGLGGAQQGDYIVLENTLTGETAAVWLDIDEAGVAPTGAEYVAADYKVTVPIVTGGTAAANAALAVTAIETSDWADDITLTDNEDGTVDVQQDYSGVTTAPDPNNADDSGVGSITTTQTTEGTAGTEYEFELEVEGGVPNIIFTTESTLPVGLELSTDGVISGTPREDGTFALTITATDHFGNEVELENKNLVITTS